MAEFEVTCKVEKGERNIAHGEDCYCYYTQPNYNERIVRCKDCKFYKEEETRWDTVEWCLLLKENGGDAVMVDPDGFCAWGEPKEK